MYSTYTYLVRSLPTLSFLHTSHGLEDEFVLGLTTAEKLRLLLLELKYPARHATILLYIAWELITVQFRNTCQNRPPKEQYMNEI